MTVTALRTLPLRFHRPSIGRVRGLTAEYTGREGAGSQPLVLKEPRGATRTGLAGAGRREVGVYQSLRAELPVRIPSLIAADPGGDWLLLEGIRNTRESSRWKTVDYAEAVRGLVALHDRFWGLGEDLGAFAWLGRPMEADFNVHVTAAAQAIQRMVESCQPGSLAGDAERISMLARLTGEADRIVEPLRRQPFTLLHGDYWPGNIAVLREGRQVVYDWQMASVGPAILDLLAFVAKSQWWFGRLPMEEAQIVGLYRELLAADGYVWSDDEWDLLWDHARMWRFLQEWIDLLAATPEAVLASRTDLLDRLWFDPVAQAVSLRLGAA